MSKELTPAEQVLQELKDLEEAYSTLRKLGVYVPGEEVRKVMSNIIMKKRS